MADRINYQNNVFTAKKFVRIGGNTAGAKEKLNSIRNTIGSKENEFSGKDIEGMFVDGILSPEEKADLKVRWDSVSLAYSRLKKDISEAFGEDGLSGYHDLDYLVGTIESMLSVVFADMDSPSVPPAGIEGKVTEFTTRYNELSQAYSTAILSILRYDVRIRTDKVSYFENDTVTVYLDIFHDNKKVEDTSVFQIEWHVTLKDNYEFTVHDNNKAISFPAAGYGDKTDVWCSVMIPVTDLLSS